MHKAKILILGMVATALISACGIALDDDDLGGVVTSEKGPEAGVWVIAETTDLPTKFARIVVTDNEGRYLVPDLPQATYNVWVRGYGLVDSPKVQTIPGNNLDLTAVQAPNRQEAAQYYPANYWYSMLHIPGKQEFPGTGPSGNGISKRIKSREQWMRLIKTDNCLTCHQMGNKATRELPDSLAHMESTVAAWERRIQSGQAGANMSGKVLSLGREGALGMFANWTDRIAAGELPEDTPPRPQGIEQNVVVTLWDWADPKAYLHDEIATDKRNPTVNAYGPIYGALEASKDYLSVLDPSTHTASKIKVPVRDSDTPFAAPRKVLQPSPYWGDEPIWDSRATVHNPMMDQKGRVWITSRIRAPANPDFCKEGSNHPSAQLFPLEEADRHLAMYDPDTQEMTLIDTCFRTHHLFFAEDDNHTIWTSGGRTIVGWLNTKMFDETGDAEKSQGWTPLVLDINGNGRQDAWTEPGQPLDPAKDKRIDANYYGVMSNPVDGSVWGTALGFPGKLIRIDLGSNPPSTALGEVYEPPWNNPKAQIQGYSPRGMDIDSKGVVWVPLASGHHASFDRNKCIGPLNGPTATGQHCPEGWTLYPTPGPHFQGITASGSADSHYYNWIDRFNTFGLGEDIPIATGNASDSLLALVDEQFIILRVPYPLGFYAKGLDGRIDDPEIGWKGRGLWSTYATRAPFHSEGGKGTQSKVVHFQLRPDPLAK